MADHISRRRFLKIGAAGAATAVLAGCQPQRPWVILEPHVRPPEQELAGVATWFATTCRQCPAGCGVVVRIINGRALKIEGNAEHPLNQGKLCARGQAGLQALYNPDRLSGPVVQAQRGSREYEAVAWEAGINALYERVRTAGDRLAVWLGSTTSGHLLDLFQRFNTAVGAPAPLVYDLYTGVGGYRMLADVNQELFGRAVLPTYNLSQADLVYSFGADLLGTWLSAVRYGREFGDFRGQALGKRGYLVQFEPRMSINGVMADRWLPVRVGSEGLVAAAMLRIIAEEGLGLADSAAQAMALVGEVDVGSVAAASDVSAEELEKLARAFAAADRPVAMPGGAMTGMHSSRWSVAAVQALNLVAGTPGEPGGLALSPPAPSEGIVVPEPVAYRDVQALIDRMQAGEIDVLLVHGANPAYDLPREAGFLEAVAKVPFVASFAPIVDETAVWADMILPDRAFLEGWGYALVSPGFGMPVVSSQQPVVTPVFDSRSTADILLTVANGIPGAVQSLPWPHEVEFLKERIVSLGPGAGGGLGPDVLWARFQQYGGWWPGAAVEPESPVLAAGGSIGTPPPAPREDEAYPFPLHIYPSGLLSDGRGASQPWLQGSPDPMTTISWQTWIEMHPETAHELGVKDGDIVEVGSAHGEIEALVYTYPAIRPDTMAIPLGQGHSDLGRYARNRGSNAMQLVGSGTDASGNSLTWADVRVQVRPTGERADLALFEFKEGVIEAGEHGEFPE